MSVTVITNDGRTTRGWGMPVSVLNSNRGLGVETNPVAILVYRASTLNTAQGWNKLSFDAILDDSTNGKAYTVGTQDLVIPEDGWYVVSGNIAFRGLLDIPIDQGFYTALIIQYKNNAGTVVNISGTAYLWNDDQKQQPLSSSQVGYFYKNELLSLWLYNSSAAYDIEPGIKNNFSLARLG